MKRLGVLPIFSYGMPARPILLPRLRQPPHTCDESGTLHFASAPAALTAGHRGEPATHPLELVAPQLVGNLAIDAPTLSPETPCQVVRDLLSAGAGPHALAVLDASGRVVGLLNRRALERLTDEADGRGTLLARPIADVMSQDPLVVDASMTLDDLSYIIVEEAGSYIYDGFVVTRGGTYVGVGTGHALMRALTERRQAHLFHLAHHDVLTGLPNRQLFEDRLQQALGSAERSHQLVAVMFLDVDRFKGVNEVFGHGLGDQLLKHVAARLAGHMRKGDTVARLNGDEFGLLVVNLEEPDAAVMAARKLLDVMGEPFELEDHEVRVSCSIGVGLYPTHATTASALLRTADAAVGQAKQIRNTFQVYSDDMAQPNRGRCTYGSLLTALEEHQLRVFYQPQIDLRTGEVAGVEALVRWQHPKDGLIPAGEVVPVAEDTGLISAMFEWVLRTACEQVGRWAEAGLGSPRLAVNVSGAQFRQDRLLPAVANILAATCFDPSRLEIEITESVVMRSSPTTLATLRQLRAMGITIAIDDFGMGYSSLGYLRRLPVDVLKIDRLFVQEIGQDEGGSAIARTIITLAHSLNLRVIAEGVETEAQLEFLRAHSCNEVQGFLFSRPLDLDATADWLTQTRRMRRKR